MWFLSQQMAEPGLGAHHHPLPVPNVTRGPFFQSLLASGTQKGQGDGWGLLTQMHRRQQL